MGSTAYSLGLVWRKRWEILLFLVAIALTALWHLSLAWIGASAAILALILATYDLPVVWHSARTALHFLQQHELELLFLIVLAVISFMWSFTPEELLIAAIGYAVVVLSVNDSIIRQGLVKGAQDARRESLTSVLLMIALALMFIWNFGYTTIFFIFVFLAFAVYRWDSRIIATGAILSLASCPVLLILSQESTAETMAVYAYYFLIMTVALQILEYKSTAREASLSS